MPTPIASVRAGLHPYVELPESENQIAIDYEVYDQRYRKPLVELS